MPRYLSREWFATTGLQGVPPARDGLRLKEVVLDTPDGTVTWVTTFGERPSITLGDGDADITFTQDYATAVALHRGELTTSEAFFQGRVRVRGQVNLLSERTEQIRAAADAFAAVRGSTTY